MSEKTFEDVLNDKGVLVWKSVGVSMLPLIREGRDIVVIGKKGGERLKKYDVALYIRPRVTGRGRYVLHRVLRVNEDGTYWIVGDNCVSGEKVREENVLGVLRGLRRKGRDVKPGAFFYRAYVLMWCAPYRVRFFILKTRARAAKLWHLFFRK